MQNKQELPLSLFFGGRSAAHDCVPLPKGSCRSCTVRVVWQHAGISRFSRSWVERDAAFAARLGTRSHRTHVVCTRNCVIRDLITVVCFSARAIPRAATGWLHRARFPRDRPAFSAGPFLRPPFIGRTRRRGRRTVVLSKPTFFAALRYAPRCVIVVRSFCRTRSDVQPNLTHGEHSSVTSADQMGCVGLLVE